MSAIQIHEIGGNCPVQAEGLIDGYGFYFRARGTTWSVEIYNGGDEPWLHSDQYSTEPYAAGWMTEDEARSFIDKAAALFRAESFADAEDGQPSEQEEWRDFDPDC